MLPVLLTITHCHDTKQVVHEKEENKDKNPGKSLSGDTNSVALLLVINQCPSLWLVPCEIWLPLDILIPFGRRH